MPTNPQRDARALSFRAPRAIFYTAFFLRIAVILIGHTYRIRTDQANFNFAFEAGRIARSLVTGHGYANPFNGLSGPTAWLPPLYPLLVALAFKLFGVYTRSAAFFLLAVDSLFSALIAPAIYELAARTFDANHIARRASKHAAPVALWSAWIWAIHPAFLQYAIHWLWEMSLTTCLFTWTLVLALRLRHIGETPTPLSSRPESALFADAAERSAVPTTNPNPATNPANLPYSLSPIPWLLFGLLWGLIALSNASLLLLFPTTLLWIALPQIVLPQTRVPHLRDGLIVAKVGIAQSATAPAILRATYGPLLAIALFTLTLTPWVIRNHQTLHAFIPTRDNFGPELYASTLDANDGLPWGTTLPLRPADPEFQQYTRMGELSFSAMRSTQAKARIHAHPGLFLRRTLNRILFFWDGTPHPTDRHPAQEFFRQLSYSFLSYAGLLGLLLMLKQRLPAAALFAACFLLLPLPYYLVTVQPRFRHPLEPLIAILMVYLFRSTQPSARSNTNRIRT